MYVDFDVHHGDGVEAIHAADPGVLTFSIHESGRYLFPGTGFAWEVGDGEAAGTVVNVPLEPETGEGAWWSIVSSLVPELAAAFSPDIIVSQHGCDTHATDPLAHLNGSTTMIGRAARLVDELAHRWTGGRWLATGGGRLRCLPVVPRSWSHVWLAAAHREVPESTPPDWARPLVDRGGPVRRPIAPRDARRPPNAGLAMTPSQADAEKRSRAAATAVREAVMPMLASQAGERG
jgi:acetoin utilization protein AcuC